MKLGLGDKVICINDSVDAEKFEEISRDFQNWVVKDEKYTIREFLENDGIVVGVLLEEIYNMPLFMKIINRVQEPAFGLFRFRKMEYSEIYMEEQNSKEETVKETIQI